MPIALPIIGLIIESTTIISKVESIYLLTF
jgi:hypothetical protein